MVKLAGAFSRFESFKALVLGDFMLDTYTTGRVKRISPEAPVPVMEVLKQEARSGGAGNVVLNLLALGGQVIAAGRIGNDREGMQLKQSLTLEGVDLSTLFEEKNYKTPVKNRLIADSQQLLRVDLETVIPLHPELEKTIIGQLEKLIPQVQIVTLSDYGKGFLTPSLIEAVLHIAKQNKIPTIVDPKGIDFAKYRGATILKPNLIEAYAAAKRPLTAPIEEVAQEIFDQVAIDLLLITRSEAGMSLFRPSGKRSDFPVRSREVKDVTGAGDTVLAMLSLGLANGLDVELSVQLANIAAGLAIERLGCVQITLPELAERLLEYDSDTKIFDENHTFALRKVLQNKRYSLLVLEKGQEMSTNLFKTIRNLAGQSKLIIYVRDSHPDDDFVHLLSSLHEVDYIILQTESLKNLCTEIHPHNIYFLQDNQAIEMKEAQSVISSLLCLYDSTPKT